MTVTLNYGLGMSGPYAPTTQKVYLRRVWSAAWVEYDLFCTEATWTCAPTISTATLVWQYGLIRRSDRTAYGVVSKFSETDIARWYVKIEYTTGTDVRRWYGVVGDVDDEQRGYVTWGNQSYASGEQTVHCYGLEYLLDREPISSSWCYTGDPAVPLRSDAPITFNPGGVGNRTDSRIVLAGGGQSAYMFDGTPEVPTRTYRPKWDDWSTRDIIEYLCELCSPSILVNGYAPGLQFKLDPVTAQLLLDDDKPTLEQEGSTVWSLLNQLIDRRRLRSFVVRVPMLIGGVESNPWLVISPMHKADIALPTGKVLLGMSSVATDADNTPTLYHVYADYDPLSSVRLRQADTLKADHIIVRGARRTSTATFTVATKRLEAGWTSAQETAYEAAASGEAGYAGWDSLKKATRNAEVRARRELSPVYCWFRLSDEWDGQAGSTATGRDVMVDAVGAQVKQYVHEVVFEPELALYENIDYSGAAVAGTLAKPRDYIYREPLLVFKRPTDNRYAIGPEMARTADGECDPTTAGTSSRFSASLRIQPDSHVVEVHVQGEPQHAIAQTDFTPLAADRDVGEYDYATLQMLLTLTLRDNRYCEGRWPAKGGSQSTLIDAQRGLIIFAGREYRQDYLAMDTVVDVAVDGTLETSTTAGYVRNDSTLLEAYARIIYEWYNSTRYALTLSTYRITGAYLRPGDMIDTYGAPNWGHHLDIGSLITEVTISSPRGEGGSKPEVQQTVTTSFGELDILALMPPDPRKT